jgi:integrase
VSRRSFLSGCQSLNTGQRSWVTGCRDTYASARLQTTDHGAPVSIFTVSRELGHGSESLVKRIYGHLGTVRHRARVVEYRVDQHRKVLKEQLAALRSGAGAH